MVISGINPRRNYQTLIVVASQRNNKDRRILNQIVAEEMIIPQTSHEKMRIIRNGMIQMDTTIIIMVTTMGQDDQENTLPEVTIGIIAAKHSPGSRSITVKRLRHHFATMEILVAAMIGNRPISSESQLIINRIETSSGLNVF